jgi:hypothetical protein
MAASVFLCLAADCHSVLGEYCGSMKKGAVMFAAVHAMANADPKWGT